MGREVGRGRLGRDGGVGETSGWSTRCATTLLSFDPRLAGADVEVIEDCGVSVSLQMEGQRRFVLRDQIGRAHV